jgi:hypothetical protein
MTTKVFRGLLLLALLAAWAIPASGAQKRQKTKTAGTRSETAAATPASEAFCPADDRFGGGAAWRAFLDPQTGQLRQPTPEEAAQLAAAVHAARIQALSELEIVVHPDGMRSVELGDAFLMDLVARRNPDGTLSIDCLPPGATGTPSPAPRAAAPVLEER